MKSINLKELNLDQLNDKMKEIKNKKTAHSFMIGMAIGILCYSIIKNGIGLKVSTVFPILLILGILAIIKKNKTNKKEVEKEIYIRKEQQNATEMKDIVSKT